MKRNWCLRVEADTHAGWTLRYHLGDHDVLEGFRDGSPTVKARSG